MEAYLVNVIDKFERPIMQKPISATASEYLRVEVQDKRRCFHGGEEGPKTAGWAGS